MLNWLKPKVDLTTEEQIEEVKSKSQRPQGQSRDQYISQILAGLDCDELPEAEGPFGTMKNPIPVNGVRGEFMYLKRLRCLCGVSLLFHRLGSIDLGKGQWPLDVFETVCMNGKHWGIFFLDMYHPRRSLKTPQGYTNAPWDKTWSPMPVAFGTTHKMDHFPQDLPQCMVKQLGSGFGESLARKCNDAIGDGSKFVPPQDHEDRKSSLASWWW